MLLRTELMKDYGELFQRELTQSGPPDDAAFSFFYRQGIDTLQGYGPLQKRFYIASLTKIFVASCLTQILTAANITSEAVVKDFDVHLPALSNLSLQSLLDHTSGLNDYVDDEVLMEAVRSSSCINETLELVMPEASITGEGEYRYSNTGYLVLGRIIETILKVDISDALNQFVRQTLGLEKTSYAGSAEMRLSTTWKHKSSWVDQVIDRAAIGFSDGALISTSEDLLELSAAINRKSSFATQLFPSSREAAKFNSPNAVYKNGLMWQKNKDDDLIYWHTGSGPGIRSLIAGCPATSESLIYLANFEMEDGENPVDRIIDAVLAQK